MKAVVICGLMLASVGGTAMGQEALSPEFEARIRALEEKAARAEALEREVVSLRGRLDEVDAEERDEALDISFVDWTLFPSTKGLVNMRVQRRRGHTTENVTRCTAESFKQYISKFTMPSSFFSEPFFVTCRQNS